MAEMRRRSSQGRLVMRLYVYSKPLGVLYLRSDVP